MVCRYHCAPVAILTITFIDFCSSCLPCSVSYFVSYVRWCFYFVLLVRFFYLVTGTVFLLAALLSCLYILYVDFASRVISKYFAFLSSICCVLLFLVVFLFFFRSIYCYVFVRVYHYLPLYPSCCSFCFIRTILPLSLRYMNILHRCLIKFSLTYKIALLCFRQI